MTLTLRLSDCKPLADLASGSRTRPAGRAIPPVVRAALVVRSAPPLAYRSRSTGTSAGRALRDRRDGCHGHRALGADPSPPATTLGRRYRITSRLGAGGSGEVFRAIDLRVGRPVALKVFTLDDAVAAGRAALRARRRASWPGCRIPASSRCFDVGADDDPVLGPVAYLAMELIEGATLRDTIAGGPLPAGGDGGGRAPAGRRARPRARRRRRAPRRQAVERARRRARRRAGRDGPAGADRRARRLRHRDQPCAARPARAPADLVGHGVVPLARAGARAGTVGPAVRRVLARAGAARVPHRRAHLPGRRRWPARSRGCSGPVPVPADLGRDWVGCSRP